MEVAPQDEVLVNTGPTNYSSDPKVKNFVMQFSEPRDRLDMMTKLVKYSTDRVKNTSPKKEGSKR